MDVMLWLRSLGLGKYEETFRDNDIDEMILPHLTAEDLKELGVASLGHRRKLLDAIAALRAEGSSGKVPSANAEPPPRAPSASPEDRAERRQVTVMFSDLVGSTALSARMDPEDLREVISAYQRCVAETVQRFGGFVARYMGDGVLVCFGYPQAHEHDAERAVRTGLELVTAVSALKTHAPLQARVGIATGLVIVGDLIGSGEAQERGIVGETPNLAARLQAIAEPNNVVIAESTRKLVGNLFDLKGLGVQELKGIVGRAQAWAVLRASSVEGRFDALHTTELTELVGRGEELEVLLRRWSKANAGEGQLVLLSGEAGIGKSRLAAALMKRLTAEPHMRLRYFCSPQHTDSAFYPIIGHLERAAGLARDDSPKTKLDKLDAVLALVSASGQDGAVLADLLSLPNDGRYPILDLTPEQRRQKTLDALTAQIEGLSRARPLLMILEDAHWADPTSVEAFGRVVDRLQTLRVLLLVTFRPEFEVPWAGRHYVTSLMLNRLSEREAGAVIDCLVGDKLLPVNMRRDIIERTDGIPLFVEEMTKAVLEAGSEAAAAQAISMVPSPAVAVPASLHASLMARLDRLGRAKEVAQIGAVIGREFSHALLAAVMQTETISAIDRLVEAGLLFRQGQLPDATYLFKHALVQDAAYGTLLREPRRALHARIAEVLETQFLDVAETQPELLARHFTQAGLSAKAAGLWGKAGLRSLERSALIEAAEQLARALNQIATLPSTPALRRDQIKLQVALITPLLHIKGYAAAETRKAAERAYQLIEQAEALGELPDDPLLLFSVLYAVWTSNYVAFKGDLIRKLAMQFLARAEKQGATAPLLIAHRLLGISLMCGGDIVQGMAHFDRAIAIYDPCEHRPLATRFGIDTNVSIRSYRSLGNWLLGYPDRALADADQGLSDAREIGQAATLMYVLTIGRLAHIYCGSYSVAKTHSDEVVALADEKGAAFWKAFGIMNQGWLAAVTDKASEAVGTLTSGIDAWRSTGSTVWMPLYLSHLARTYSELGEVDEAWRCIGETMTVAETTKERWFEAEANRIAGEIALRAPKPDTAKAEEYFERAIAVSRQQQAKSWQLRASMSLARLWRSQGKVQQARELLAPVYGWFTEGFDTRDLKEAKALLEELAA